MRPPMNRAAAAHLFLCGALLNIRPVLAEGPPPVAPAHPYEETLFGQTISDPYRYMESLDAETLAWIRAQGRYTRRIFDSIGPREGLLRRMSDFGAGFGLVLSSSSLSQPYEVYDHRIFYTERLPGSDNVDLFVKDHEVTRKLLDVGALRAAHGGKPYAINYFEASPDGARVAVGISESGSEETSIYVYDTETGHKIAGPVDRAQYALPRWSQDGRALYFNRLALFSSNDPPAHKYLNSTAVLWDLKSEPQPLIGKAAGNTERLQLKAEELPFIVTLPGGSRALFVNRNGVQNELEIWLAPNAAAPSAATRWLRIATREDDVTDFSMRGEDIYLLSHHEAPTFKVLALRAGQKIDYAKVLMPADPHRVIESIHAASDGLYVLSREGIYSRLLCIADDGRVKDVPLPFRGYVSAEFADARSPGVTMTLESWNMPPSEYALDPKTGMFTALGLGVRPPYDPQQFEVEERSVTAADGVQVPLSIVAPKGSRGTRIVILDAYGSYGIAYLPEFSPRIISMLHEDTTYAVCHVRGGGELGEAWRLGGTDANKPNTWRDMIACAQDLIMRGVTDPHHLFITGGSAGGITVGRAMTERPELFAGVIDRVPAANTLRAEFSPNGPPNIPEFGTVTTEQGFKNLLAMDSYQAVRAGVQYPAVLITTGLNDPRVSPWEPAKLAAKLQHSGTSNVVMLRVEEEAGHGIGSTKTQKDQEWADIGAFIFWRAGRSGWQPAMDSH